MVHYIKIHLVATNLGRQLAGKGDLTKFNVYMYIQEGTYMKPARQDGPTGIGE